MPEASAPTAVPDRASAAETLRNALQADRGDLVRGLTAAVRKTLRPASPDRLRDELEWLLGETAVRALAAASSYDPARRPIPWLMGIALNALSERRRGEARARRRAATETDLGDPAWQAALAAVCHDPADPRPAAEADALERLRAVLPALPAADRRALELRIFQGLDGEALAAALPAASAGAARVRVHRALNRLRELFFAEGGPSAGCGEVSP
jgi:RNA polymerase sigma-70 factor (ECF subfamily)